jgi:hypothetical protein
MRTGRRRAGVGAGEGACITVVVTAGLRFRGRTLTRSTPSSASAATRLLGRHGRGRIRPHNYAAAEGAHVDLGPGAAVELTRERAVGVFDLELASFLEVNFEAHPRHRAIRVTCPPQGLAVHHHGAIRQGAGGGCLGLGDCDAAGPLMLEHLLAVAAGPLVMVNARAGLVRFASAVSDSPPPAPDRPGGKGEGASRGRIWPRRLVPPPESRERRGGGGEQGRRDGGERARGIGRLVWRR